MGGTRDNRDWFDLAHTNALLVKSILQFTPEVVQAEVSLWAFSHLGVSAGGHRRRKLLLFSFSLIIYG